MTYTSCTSFGMALFALASTYLVFLYRRRLQKPDVSLLYPPGPPLSDMPTFNAWVKFREWGKEYGELVYVREGNILIINHFRVANDLLEKRAHKYSDRVVNPMMELCGVKYFFSLSATINRFYPFQYAKIHQYLRNLSTSPDKFMQHTLRLSQAIILSSLYGIDIDPEDRLARMATESLDIIGQTQTVGAFPTLRRFPWLRYMPSWFPGCAFQEVATQCLEKVKTMDTIPYNMAIENRGLGTSIIAELAAQNEGNPNGIEAVKKMGIISYVGKAVLADPQQIHSFLLVMTLNPDVQTKGQTEIDRVIGQNRLPTFTDRPSLPYVEAIYRELMRLHPPIPNGVSHASIEDDFYRGYHIPKGCTIIPNIWAMNRDEEVYSEPEKFMPERFLDSPAGPFTSINDIHSFGFGRRVCAGRFMADNTVWLAIASVLATLTLGKAKDDEGKEIDILGEYTDGMFRHTLQDIPSENAPIGRYEVAIFWVNHPHMSLPIEMKIKSKTNLPNEQLEFVPLHILWKAVLHQCSARIPVALMDGCLASGRSAIRPTIYRVEKVISAICDISQSRSIWKKTSLTTMLLLLAREIRDHIYDELLLDSNDDHTKNSDQMTRRITVQWTRPTWDQLPLSRGTCFGLIYSCRQIYSEVLEFIERHGGVSFKLALSVSKLPHERLEQILPRWNQFALLQYPKSFQSLAQPSTNSKCRNFHFTFEIQSEQKFWWLGSGGPAFLARNLFSMFAEFLLHGPLGLHRSLPADSDLGNMWDIDTLVVDVVGGGTSFTEMDSGRLCTVPDEVLEDSQRQIAMYLDRVCCSGSLAKRVRLVKLSVDGKIKREWLIDQGKSLTVKIREEWAVYGWVIEKKEKPSKLATYETNRATWKHGRAGTVEYYKDSRGRSGDGQYPVVIELRLYVAIASSDAASQY
ncbi:cytochrome P450 [Lentinula aciculospora]|uniref:Cytochrome P450 n=1 Tax=Lentinula aciculospora TaxID=153920 RepID=A0A9W9DU24_9AGAR|nr:cytochrome P450 [Lentinula aciculospora]